MEEYSIHLKDVDECRVLYKYLLLNEYEGVRWSCLADTVETGIDIHGCLRNQETCTIRKDTLRYLGFGSARENSCTLEEFLETDNRVKI